MLGFDFAERIRHLVRHRHAAPASRRDWALFAVSQLGAGALVALLLVGYEVVLGNAVSATSVDALHFSLHPWGYAAVSRIAFAIAVILAQGVVLWTGALIVQLTSLPWRIPRTGAAAVSAFLFRALPIMAIAAYPRIIGAAPSTVPPWPTAIAGVACLALAWGLAWGRPQYRHASQALRLFSGAMALLIPALVLYPSLLHFADRGLRRLIEERYAEQAYQQRNQLQDKVRAVLEQIDRERLAPLTDTPAAPDSLWQGGAQRLVADRSGHRPAGRVHRAVWPAGRARQPLRVEPAGIPVERAAMARAELPVGNLRRGVAVRLRRAAAAARRPRHLRGQLRHAHRRLDCRERHAGLRDAAVHHRAQSVLRSDARAG